MATAAGLFPALPWCPQHIKEMALPGREKIQATTASGNLFAQHNDIRLIQLHGEVRPVHTGLSMERQKGSGFSIG